jgi:ribosomal protein S18 acetylase RimI-like enzyme
MSAPIVIEQMRADDVEAVLRFLSKAYDDNPRQSEPAFWDWHFRQHPSSDTERPPVWLARSENRIAGQIACIPIEIHVRNEVLQSAWILDAMTDPEFRRRGIMKNLVREIHERYSVVLGVNTNEQHAPAMLQSIGWKIVGLIPRYHKLLYPGHDIKQISPSGAAAKAINLAFTPFRPRRLQKAAEVREVSRFTTEFEDLWKRSHAQWKCSVRRTPDTLAWQFSNQPGKKFHILGHYSDGMLDGYAVLFFRSGPDGTVPKAAISDICYAPENAENVVDELLGACLASALGKKAGGIVVDVMDELIESRLQAAGFWKIKSPLQLMAWSRDGDQDIADPRSWFLTRGDADISIFEKPNL